MNEMNLGFLTAVVKPCAILLLALLALPGCSQSVPPSTQGPAIKAPGLQNVFRITDTLYSGSVPEGEEGFRSLQKLGIKTVLTVDGATPDVATAHKFGMSYVHLPVGYDGIPHEQALRLARAARDLPGPIYVHCHHGQHRGPAAAAVMHLCLDQSCPVETVIDEMRRAGTDPRYKGLYESARSFHRPNSDELSRVSGDFPEAAPPEGLAKLMVQIDERMDNLKRLRFKGWQVDPAHPDIDPPHEALQLVENAREAQRLPDMAQRTEEFREMLTSFTAAAEQLEKTLRSGKDKASEAEEPFNRVQKSCSQCHARYRDSKSNKA